jgi:predicted nucleic acid-binding protein
MIAFDTNVFIYACDKAEPVRQQVALDLIAKTTDGVILWQVACEFVAASRKLDRQGFTAGDAWARLAEFLEICRLIPPAGAAVLDRAKTLHLAHDVSFWDAMVLAACLDAGITVLYSEDIPGLAVGDLAIVNPFN